MATTKVLTVGPGLLQFGESNALKDASAQVTKCTIVPSANTGSPIVVLTGESVPGARTESFTLKGSMLQDLGETQSIVEWFWQERGKQHKVKYVPATGNGKAFTGIVIIEAVEIGGEAGAPATTDFEFQFVGAPSISEA